MKPLLLVIKDCMLCILLLFVKNILSTNAGCKVIAESRDETVVESPDNSKSYLKETVNSQKVQGSMHLTRILINICTHTYVLMEGKI